MHQSSRLVAASGIVVVLALFWIWIAATARDMYGSMSGLSAWMMTSTWDPPHLLLLWLMWAVMMAAMMLPSAVPLLLLYDGALRRRATARHVNVYVAAMAAGYVAVWAAFSVGATALQRLLSTLLLLTPMMEMTSSAAIGITLLVVGLYQLTPWKGRCLLLCRSPLTLVMHRWRTGVGGAMRMGAEHGVYCVGCCWALMLLLFAGGVMNLMVITGLTVVVLVEKLSPIGSQASRGLGGLLCAAGVWLLFAGIWSFR
jgi:predicted metal-binding membrane protein